MPIDGLALAMLAADPARVRVEAAAGPVRGADRATRCRLIAARAFAEILESQFAAALDLVPDPGADAHLLAVHSLAAAMCGVASASTSVVGPFRGGADAWPCCVTAETQMSLGRLDRAEHLARLVWERAAPDDPNRLFAGQTLARALLFQGRLLDAGRIAGVVRTHARRIGLDAIALVASGTLAYIAALSGRRAELDRHVDAIEAHIGHVVPSYVATGGIVMACFALAADGRAARSATLLLDGCGGPTLARIQLVDRAYGYELLITAALAQGDLTQARGWSARACALEGFPTDGMAAAAIARAAARVAAADGDFVDVAVLTRVADRDADRHFGRLDAARAQLLAGSAMLNDVAHLGVAENELRAAAARAHAMGAVALRVLAARELRSVGLRLSGVPPAPMTPRESEVATLLAEGLSNGEIAHRLGISARTVQSHVARVLSALGVSSRSAVPHALGAAARPGTAVAPTTAATAATAATAGHPLTARQAEVAELVRRGFTNAGIARSLALSVKTVEKHLGDMYVRLDIPGRTSLAARAGAPA